MPFSFLIHTNSLANFKIKYFLNIMDLLCLTPLSDRQVTLSKINVVHEVTPDESAGQGNMQLCRLGMN